MTRSAFAALLTLALVASGPSLARAERKPIRAGEQAPDFELPGLLDGRPLALRSLRGKVVVLDFWATWCGPCKEELGHLEELARKTARARKAVAFVAVDTQDERDDARAFAEGAKLGSLRLLFDPDGAALALTGHRALPVTLIIDRKGTVRHVYTRFTREALKEMERQIDALLRAK